MPKTLVKLASYVPHLVQNRCSSTQSIFHEMSEILQSRKPDQLKTRLI